MISITSLDMYSTEPFQVYFGSVIKWTVGGIFILFPSHGCSLLSSMCFFVHIYTII